jgi:hypothetical protein
MQPDSILNAPAGHYGSLREWIAASGSDAGKVLLPVEFGERTIPLRQPAGLEHPVHWRLRFAEAPESRMRSGFVAVLPGARLCGTMCHIVTPDDKLLAEFSLEWKKRPEHRSIYERPTLPPLRELPGTAALLAIKDSGVYYHWMLDVLPRLLLLRRCGIVPDYYILNGHRQAPFQLATLEMLGVPRSRIVYSSDTLHIQPEKLVVPGFTSGIRARWACDFLRTGMMVGQGIEPVQGYERIYISREQARKRKLLNETEALGVLEKRGFRKVTLEALPLREQIRIFASAQIVAGPHGAGFTNLLFSRPGTKVIELFSPNLVHTCYPILSSLIGHRHYYLVGEGERPPEFVNPHARGDDITVNTGELTRLLKLAEAD